MSEQQLADLFSDQVDRLLQGKSTTIPADAADLEDLLDIVGKPTTQTQFQASSAAQAIFQSQIAAWFGLANGGPLMTILGLSKVWIISIVVTVVTVIVGTGLIAVIATTSIFAFGPISQLPVPPTEEPTDQPTEEPTDLPTEEPTEEPTAEPTDLPPNNYPPTLIFISTIQAVHICQGAYITQGTLVNYGTQPVTDAALAWEVIDGAGLVDDVSINSTSLAQSFNETKSGSIGTTSTTDPPAVPISYANFSPISVEQKVKLNIKVKVKDAWWDKPDGTQIKVKLSVKNKIKLDGDDSGHSNASQIVTIVKHGAEWATLTGPVQSYGQNLLVDGVVVTTNSCTGLPPTLHPGSNIKVIGLLQPNGTFVAININIINKTIINIDFDSGVPMPSGSGGSGGSKGGSGGHGSGGSKGGSGSHGSGGSKGGSHKK